MRAVYTSRGLLQLLAVTTTALFAAAGCGDDASVTLPPATHTAGGSGGAGDGGHGGDLFTGGQGGTGGGGGGNACAGSNCPPDQHCEVADGGPECVNNTCDELDCGPTELCETTPGGGAICRDISCTDDIDCPPSQFCDTTICVDDVCQPGDRHCAGLEIYECLPNGSGDAFKWTCGSAASYISDCVDDGQGYAYCGCEGDWDCPPYTACEAGQCSGTGVAPTCFLAPEPFTNVLPTPEIIWGGNPPYPGPNTYATNSACPEAAQVVLTPLVANLDDDNGDGFINELDFPEIIFTGFRDHAYTTDGVLRAIHGGGPNKGQDFFATWGTNEWHEGEALPGSCNYASADIDASTGLAVGDLDYDGVPEIVAILENNAVRIYSNTGSVLATSAVQTFAGADPTVSIANVDGQGYAEVIVGRTVLTFETDGNGDLAFLDRFRGSGTCCHGTNGQGEISCVANLSGDQRLEIIAGGRIYGFPNPPAGATKQADCATFPPTTAEETAYCTGALLTNTDDPAYWNAGREGFCAIADVLGADQTAAPGPSNPLDEVPEVILVTDGRVRIYNGQDGTEQRNLPLNGTRGGAPNVDDFDGDGFPEIGSAGSSAYVVIDLQASGASCPAWTSVTHDNSTLPRTPLATPCQTDADCGDVSQFVCNTATSGCVCLHNSWLRATEDDSSQVTGSSVFDFNGDGAAEVVYNDECQFRVYDGLDGTVLFSVPSESRTRIEYPVVADADNDGNAEIIFCTTTESGFCSEGLTSQYNNGIEVWGDAGDYWVSARRIWNQHAYHVTHVTESGAIPLVEPEGWRDLGGRKYNIYRSNPRSQGVAPDLTVAGVQISSPDATCGELSTLLDISVKIENRGDLRVGPGVVVGFWGQWGANGLEPLYADGAQTPLTYVLQSSLEPGNALFIQVSYDSANNINPAALPDTITVVVDQGDLERECIEDNNELQKTVEAGQPMADLLVELGTPAATPACPTVPTTVLNNGSAAASNVVVRYYAGNPSQGGYALFDELFAGPIAAGGSESRAVAIPGFPSATTVTIWAVVDPDNAIEECNDGNNADAADTAFQCGGIT